MTNRLVLSVIADTPEAVAEVLKLRALYALQGRVYVRAHTHAWPKTKRPPDFKALAAVREAEYRRARLHS